MSTDHLEAISKVRLFESLNDKDRLRLADISKAENYGPGESIIVEGEQGTSLYIIASGAVKVTKRGHHGGDEDIVTLRAGTYFGLNALVEASSRSANVLAKDEAVVLKVSYDDLEASLLADPAFASRFWRAAARGLSRQLRRVTTDTVVLRELIRSHED